MTEVLSDTEWEARAAAHRDRLTPFVAEHRRRAARGEKHPVWDFLFTYYGHRPAHLLRWHPGLGTELDGPRAAEAFDGARGYAVAGTRVRTDPRVLARRVGTAAYVARLLEATATRAPVFGCFGLHEWAMVYREADQARHPVPLRLGPAGTDEVVRAGSLRCTHYDAFRFFTPDAAPRNATPLTREGQVDSEQPGCLHAGMDLYKWSFKLTPGAPSGLVADAFDLARDARELDMRASPYDLAEYGFEPIAIETPEGRREYVRQQVALAERAAPIRARLLDVVRAWPGERPASDMSASPA
ncbi:MULTISPECIES: 3-methyladenine DNA glycosylase [Tsukamurella]|uniref:3-methyladenine DNA glycosylase n=2 Tax=Tsukamurella TaxID=2060 RepID=A0A5C5RVQ3_9ACTN|nr:MULTISPECIES: 3-methyladenine DNA glycosylase [Tsukamurella]NMD54054.1 3-methyladenine DNA glycosylase [Tsukamurella columbiensis]TWS27116.1 3-methyladenine DNA glycosylase [Tsukamurella conjunctivitidis]